MFKPKMVDLKVLHVWKWINNKYPVSNLIIAPKHQQIDFPLPVLNHLLS